MIRTLLLPLLFTGALHATGPTIGETAPAPAGANKSEKAAKFCSYIEECNRSNPGKSAYCVKTGLKEAEILNRVLEGETAKDLPRHLRRAGFHDVEGAPGEFESLAEGAILVLDVHDPLKDKKPGCPKVYGNVLVKCDGKWVDDRKYDLRFHLSRGCRTKGVWVHPDLSGKPNPG
ncbi:MAG: hypothetical protein HC902_12670 [Calothrix sp. SM1_5_4]|nr:hypothetical protein [Calothrix sp. SM1_5_4]